MAFPFSRAVAAIALSWAATACDSTVIVGTRVCPQSPGGAAAPPDPDASVGLGWSTGFEDGFCDYGLPTGFCLPTGTGSYTLVTSPVHSGKYAAAFSVNGIPDAGGQSRCVQQGVFPSAAYYGAWYYVPAPTPVNTHVWNLFHFQSAAAGQGLQGLWDVSLINGSDGGPPHAILFDFLPGGGVPDAGAVPPIPTDQWFHLEFYFNRKKDATGELSLWQDGVPAGHLAGVVTDPGDWGQWFVGNFADNLMPPTSTVYVDDLTINATR